MARMSIDDSMGRDPRVLILAQLCGWSRRETMGALLDVWAICYDRVTPFLPALQIDKTADLSGFTKHLIEAGLAQCHSGGRIYLHGVKERIKYLEGRAEAGRRGGVKSGESRRKKREANTKQTFKQTQARLNLPDPVPDSAPVPDVSPAPAVSVSPDPAPPRTHMQPQLAVVPLRRHPETPTLAQQLWKAGCDAYAVLRAEGLDAGLPASWTAIPSATSREYEQLCARVDELLDARPPDDALAAGLHRIVVATAEARARRSLEYFPPMRMWHATSFHTAIGQNPAKIRARDAGANPTRECMDELAEIEARDRERERERERLARQEIATP